MNVSANISANTLCRAGIPERILRTPRVDSTDSVRKQGRSIWYALRQILEEQAMRCIRFWSVVAVVPN